MFKKLTLVSIAVLVSSNIAFAGPVVSDQAVAPSSVTDSNTMPQAQAPNADNANANIAIGGTVAAQHAAK